MFKIKASLAWKSFIEYFELYFNIENPESQAISGGRYGCAHFLKICSNHTLKNCSLGKLSYMVQLAIDEELLRYHKTLLVWVPAFDNKTKEDNHDIFIVKKIIVEVLRESQEGISLAQLPLYLKEKVPFELDISKLGFAKLKDLISTIPDIEIVSKGKNHPFATLKKIKYPSLEIITGLVSKKLSEKVAEISKNALEQEIFETFGYNFTWSVYKFKNIEEFIKTLSDYNLTSQGIIKKNIKNTEKFHSYTSSTNSEPYSCGSHLNLCIENISNDIDTTRKENIDSFEEFAEMQTKYIEELLDEDDLSSPVLLPND